jgi:hypothetical protein
VKRGKKVTEDHDDDDSEDEEEHKTTLREEVELIRARDILTFDWDILIFDLRPY